MLPFSDLPSANILWTLDLIATILSFFGSLWIIFCCLKAPSPKSLSLKIIAAIGCADLLYSIANLLSNFEKNALFIDDPEDFNLCILEAFLRQASYVLSIFFSTCAAVASYYSVCPTRRLHKTVFLCIVIALGFIIPAFYIIVLPQFFEGSIVTAQGPFYCWLTYSTNPKLSTFTKVSLTMTFQGSPVIVGLLITLIAYTLAIKKLREIPKDLLEAYNINIYRVLWYPGILFLTFVPTVVDTVLRVFFVQRPVWINALHLLLTHSNGFNNALLYGIQTNLYHTNYEEFETKSGGLDDGADGSYASMAFSENTRKSSISDTLKEAYST